MRYLDSARDGSGQALGAWLRDEVARGLDALRWQTGYFGADGLGFLLPVLGSIPTVMGLIGSNGGETLGDDVRRLVRAVGLPRPGARLGVVRVEGGLFHPKVVHVVRSDGTAAAYVGSANLSARGVAGTNVEAGVTFESGDAAPVLEEIAASIDSWFENAPGLIEVRSQADVDALVEAGDLARTRPPRPPTSRTKVAGVPSRELPRRAARITVPAVPPWVATEIQSAATPAVPYDLQLPTPPNLSDASAPPAPPAPLPPPLADAARPPATVATWTKKLSKSDAQRKPTGNQRGSITLVQSVHEINAATYFRRDFFANEGWVSGHTNTGEPRETAQVTFDVTFLGTKLGALDIPISFAPNREASQDNYTSLLHLGPLASHVASTDVTGKWIELARRSDGSYTLQILDAQP